MAGHAVPPVEEFHHLGTQPHIELLLEQRVGYGVGVAFDFHMVIDIDPGVFPFGICIWLHRQRSERRAVRGNQTVSDVSQAIF
jgi:hypothetical protein